MVDRSTTRRALLARGATVLGALALAGCENVTDNPLVKEVLGGVGGLNRKVQEAMLGPEQLAQEYELSDVSTDFYANGSTDPDDKHYRSMAANGFKAYKLVVDGLVERPIELTMAELRAMPARTQITRHDCVEGWSCIGQWTGAPLQAVLDRVGVKPTAQYVVFHCFDTMDDGDPSGPTPFYGSIDLLAARHPQTILAYDKAGKPLEVKYGAPLRLRVERQLGYKMTKYIKRIQLMSDFKDIGQGKGGYWEDTGYQWYAGI
ncbi:molybdopterin-binding protein [Lichenibacterium minor]|uniref:Molybdopterin-binding protein n=1 Tax=Lichenibacterium minor TaxID=2316528 RepID=A0A4Q2U660_9HYPH|nr:molybdopterin-dependent oxidoreductase [Lichenibacterium minor]RYC30336.1 molybdopterin-binding protein [Lichenibacterium minor]